jgi:arylsulfatase A-like enzyme
VSRRAALWLLFALSGCERKASGEAVLPSASASVTVPAPASASASVAAIDAAAPPEPHRPVNVLLIVIDSLRTDVPWHGYRRMNAPRLTALARQAVVYRRAYAISSTTARSIAPLLVGRYPSEMIRSGEYFTRWYPDNLFLGERLTPLGIKTLALHSHAYFFRATGMGQGFEDYRVLPGTVLNDPEPEPTAEQTTETAKRMLRRAADPDGQRSFFGYLHYLDPHAPYLEHEDRPDFGEEPRDLYDQEVHYTDDWVGALIDWVKKQPWGARTAIIVTADHGECFGEHGQQKHGYELWEELVHVPLLFFLPHAAPRVLDVPRSHIDLAPTILELMGAPADRKLRGKSLVAELYGGEAPPRPVLVDLPRDNLQDRRRAVIDGDDKLIARGDDDDDDAFWLYDLAKDPRERRNLANLDPVRFRRMRKLYTKLWSAIPTRDVRGDVVLKNAPEGRRW